MKCVICQRRKGKRPCPAKGASICSQCCGEKRVIEIDCPADCHYLTAGQAYQVGKNYVAHLVSEPDLERRKVLYETSLKYAELIDQVEAQLAQVAAGTRLLEDGEVKEAFELLIKNYRTEQSGLVYSHSSPRPQVQFLVRELGKFLEGLRQEAKIGETPGLGLEDLICCLDWLGSKVDFQLKRQGGAGRDYLKLVARSHPGSRPKASGKLIYP